MTSKNMSHHTDTVLKDTLGEIMGRSSGTLSLLESPLEQVHLLGEGLDGDSSVSLERQQRATARCCYKIPPVRPQT